MIPSPIELMNENLLLLAEGAVFWPDRHLLIVADLHLEKGTSRRGSGILLPPYDTRLTLDRLSALIAHWKPHCVLALGDNFHDGRAAERLLPEDRARLATMAKGVALVWLTGNHDPQAVEEVPGVWLTEWQEGPFSFRHIPSPNADLAPGIVEFSGHLHPKARISIRGHSLTRSCFATNDQRVILPAFGSYTGGLDVRDPAISALLPKKARLYLLGKDRLHRLDMAMP
ncbi:ligase-associated DNA damage response endonuclease PdeM [Kozakia baliensis]|uniref:ligase-associated DNA damage response endonuclease PdeM n=1 Tax=Kozakia baliensis TaxID=153496 RepID=UPI00087CD3E0|nr:ligase-associated DNA damage response endonuclease PdeM [Kozakia baliensis]AOX19926.1 hypothetical protein A0U90_06085 [Kozakia baliensis]